MERPDLSSYDTYLRQRGLAANTRRAYLGILTRASPDPVAWYLHFLTLRERPPTGTIAQARAAVAHWLRMNGADEAKVHATLPPTRGRKSEESQGLSPLALETYNAAAGAHREPVRTILLLLPLTGLRISAMCNLRRSNIIEQEAHTLLSFRGKGDKHRVVPLGSVGAAHLNRYLTLVEPGCDVLFPGRFADRPMCAWSIQEACRQMRASIPLLKGLTPHTLRHTYATKAIGAGVDLARLKKLLGHENIATTQRYLHPSVDDLAAAVGSVEGL